jgi:hypothetical protein
LREKREGIDIQTEERRCKTVLIGYNRTCGKPEYLISIKSNNKGNTERDETLDGFKFSRQE